MDSKALAFEPPRLKSSALLREHVQWINAQIAEAKIGGQPTAWCTAISPNELLRSMGVLPVFPEAHAVSCGVRKAGGPACEAAEAAGYSTDICSYVKVDIAT